MLRRFHDRDLAYDSGLRGGANFVPDQSLDLRLHLEVEIHADRGIGVLASTEFTAGSRYEHGPATRY